MQRFLHARQRRRSGARVRGSSARRMASAALPALAAGAAIEFFLDPRSGRRRRTLVRDRARAAVHRRSRQAQRQVRYEAGKLVRLRYAVRPRREPAAELDDTSLVRKVRSELFRDRTIPKGQISINADRGIVVLRGALDDEAEIARIERATRAIAGVRDVENLLHIAGTPSPHSHPHPR
jgi:hyperosmotically inducible periplasmic protein